MYRKMLFLGGPVIAVCMMVVLGGIAIRAQPPNNAVAPLTENQVQNIQADVAAFLQRSKVAQPAAAAAAAQPTVNSALVQQITGAFTYANIKAQIDSVGNEALRQDIDSVWETFRPVPVVILLEDPTGKAQVRMAIGLTLPPGSKVQPRAPLRVVHLPIENSVRHIHLGPQSQLANVFGTIDAELKKAGEQAGFPVVLQCIEDPGGTANLTGRTLINVPMR